MAQQLHIEKQWREELFQSKKYKNPREFYKFWVEYWKLEEYIPKFKETGY